MDLDEFEAWFEQEKEILVNEYKKKLIEKKDFEKHKAVFNKKFNALLEKYNTFYSTTEKREKFKKKFGRPFVKLGEQIDKIVELFKEET